MKKLISVILAIFILVSLMASCKSKSEMEQVSSDIASESVDSYDNQVYSSEPITDGSDSFQNSDPTNNNQNNITNNSNQTKSNSKNTLKNIPKYIGYKTASGKSEILNQAMSTKHTANVMPLMMSKGADNAFSIETLSGKIVENSYIGGQNPVLTLLVENTERDAIVDVLVDDTENGINNVYSTSATKYKINRVDTEYNQERKTYVTEIELSIPAPKKEGSRTITIKEIGFLRAYVKGTAEMPQNVPKIVNYKVINNKYGAGGCTIIETKEDLIAVHNNLSGKYALGNDIDLGGMEWTPIGTNAKPFTGEFHGDGYTVSNYKITKFPASLEDGVGFFGNIGERGYVEQVIVAGTINIEKAKYVGGVAGKSENNVIGGNKGNINVNEAEYVAGVIGMTTGSWISGFNSGNIHVKNGNAAGMASKCSGIDLAYNTGTITAQNGIACGIVNSAYDIALVYTTGKIYGGKAFGVSENVSSRNGERNIFWYDDPQDDATVAFPQNITEGGGKFTKFDTISDMFNLANKLNRRVSSPDFVDVPNRTPKLKWER